MMNEYDFGHVMLSLWYHTLAVWYYFFTENISILMSFVKEDADVDYISLDLHLIKCTLITVRVGCDVCIFSYNFRPLYLGW